MSSLGKRDRYGAMRASRNVVAPKLRGRARQRTSKPKGFEGLRNGVATSGSSAPEVKNYDNIQAPAGVTASAPFVASTTASIVEGTADNQRVGMKINLKSLEVEMNVVGLVGATAGPTGLPVFIDVMAVWDKQPNQGVAAAATIWSLTTSNCAFLNVAQTERFVVLRRERIFFDLYGGVSKTVVWHIPLDMAVKFPEGAEPPNSNDILICALSTSTGTTTTTIGTTVNYLARMKYIDA